MPAEYGKIIYSYGTKMNIFKKKVYFNTTDDKNATIYAENVEVPASSYFKEIPADKEYVLSQYDLVAGKYPEKHDELCLILDKNNRISDAVLLAFLMDINASAVDEKGEFIVNSYDYDKFLGTKNPDGTRQESSYGTFTLALNDGLYIDGDANGVYEKQITELFNVESFKNRYEAFYSQIEQGIKAIGKKASDIKCYAGNTNKVVDLKITAILRLKEDTTTGIMGAYPIGYTSDLTEYVRTEAESSAVVQAQIAEWKNYLIDSNDSCVNVVKSNTTIKNESEYVNALKSIGYAELPTKVEFYANDFDSKEAIKQYIADYNKTVDKEERINVTDVVSSIVGIIATFIDIITYVLLALTAISLVVSAIMIAIITYVSVIERTKEIGILRSIGARKVDVMSVFNAETVIIGLISGVLGIIIALIVQIPLEIILHNLTGIGSLVALSPMHALLLIAISVIVTLLSGMIPALMASKRDPVKALRSE
jgi:putative ABC transport system permease protein